VTSSAVAAVPFEVSAEGGELLIGAPAEVLLPPLRRKAIVMQALPGP
jgi:hypothetical protein